MFSAKNQSRWMSVLVIVAFVLGAANAGPALATYTPKDLPRESTPDVKAAQQSNESLLHHSIRQRTSDSPGTNLVNWSALVLIYRDTDADFVDKDGKPQHYSSSLSDIEVDQLRVSALDFPRRVQDWSNGMASISLTVRVVTDTAITHVTPVQKSNPDPTRPDYWLEPSDTEPRLSNELANGSYDSVIVLWNSGRVTETNRIPTSYGGLAYLAPVTRNGFTFTWATGVYNAHWYQEYYPGEGVLHEWLHGVGGYYRGLGYQVADPHEASNLGYYKDPNGSWESFYRDLMQGQLVTPNREHSGISDAVWRAGNIRAVNRPLPAQLLSPFNGSSATITPQLKWAKTIDPDYAYLVNVFDTADLGTPIYSTTTTGNSLGIPGGILTLGKTYEWTVRAMHDGAQAPASAPLRFTVDVYAVISGNVGTGGVTLSYVDGTLKIVKADGKGNYSFPVPYNWSGTVTPSRIGVTFTPASRSYTNVITDQTAQDYAPTLGWHTVGVAGFSADATYYTTLALDNGTPYVAYSDKAYAWKATVMKFDGQTGNWVPVGSPGFSLTGFPAGSERISLVVDNGTPYVAYQDDFKGDRVTVMKFNGSSWVTVGPAGFSAGDYATNISLAVANGTPYVAYTDYPHRGGQETMVKKFMNGVWVNVGPPGFFASIAYRFTSLDIHDGTPYVTYWDFSDPVKEGVMKFDASTGNWVTLGSDVLDIYPSGFWVSGSDMSYAWDNCTPYATNSDGNNGNKATVKKFDAPTGKWVTVGSPGFSAGIAYFTSLALDHSTPFVAYKAYDSPYKATVMKLNALTGSWDTVGPADFSADAVGYPSLALDHGRPYVAYMDWSLGGKATVMTFVDAPGIPDVTPPGVDTFRVDSPSASLAIPIAAFTASDSVDVTGYMITEDPMAPPPGSPGWSKDAPTTYTVAGSGSYTLYPWARDAAGNVSALFCSPASVTVDATAPTVDSFTAHSPSSSLDIPITTFTASDDTAVTGYMITESSTSPAAGDSRWSGAAPTIYTVHAEGSYTLYPWAKDALGNVSAVFGSPASVKVDTPPTVDSFVVASTSASFDIPIIDFTASDTFGVTGYLITESPTAPAASAAGWSGTAPTTYTVGAEGNYTLYPWAKDAAGNVSAVYDYPASVVVHFPATIIVTSNADSGARTLRQAIADARPGDRITFDSSLSGATITLASTLAINKSLTIDGSSLASLVTISGAGAYRVFNVGGDYETRIAVTFDSLTISHGYLGEDGGAGIANVGILIVANSTLSGNSAGDGGGIHNGGILTVRNSTFSGNSATGNGGGIYNVGALMVTNSTFSGDSASGDGGGIYNLQGTLEIRNSTLSGNSAGSGGGIYNDYYGTLDYSNTIIANSPAGDDVVNLGDSSGKNNLSGIVSLGALADNGGPTPTMALPAGSPAIDAGDNAICAASPVNGLDQRGVARGAACDIGAYEYVASPGTTPPTVNAGIDAVILLGNPYTGAGTFSDPDPDTWTATVDYGDDSGVQPLALNPDKTFSLNHAYAAAGTYLVTVTVSDSGGGVGSDTLTVRVLTAQFRLPLVYASR